jgi:2-haloalkanoic acid dehalogenase type II
MTDLTEPAGYPRAILFDLLTALLDSWTLWNRCAGSETAGRTWRAEYLRLTYGCGAYEPYEELVRRAASNVGLPASVPESLEAHWEELQPWEGAAAALDTLAGHCRLGIVTNCSARLGELAARRLDVKWDVIVTAERAGYYKPHPWPYQLALTELGVHPSEAAFVAGSGYDVFGTSQVGLRTYWHNRIGLAAPPGAPAPEIQSRTLDELPAWVRTFRRT